MHSVWKFFLKQDRTGHSAVVAEDSVELLGDPDEGGPAAQLLQFACTHIGAGGADAAQDVSYRLLHRTFVRNFDCLSLRCSGAKNTQRRQCKHGVKHAHQAKLCILAFGFVDVNPASL